MSPRATLRIWFGVLRDNLGDRVHDVLQGRRILHKALVLLQPFFPAIHLFQHQAQCLLAGLRLPPVEVQRSLEAAVAHQDQARFLPNRLSRRAQCPRREAHRLAQRMPKQVQGVLHAAGAKQRCGVQGRPQLPGAKPPVCSANVTVRSSKVLSRLWAMSRMRKFHSVPWLKGGCSAPRQSNTICQRLSITVSSTASRSPT